MLRGVGLEAEEIPEHRGAAGGERGVVPRGRAEKPQRVGERVDGLLGLQLAHHLEFLLHETWKKVETCMEAKRFSDWPPMDRSNRRKLAGLRRSSSGDV